MGNQAGLKAHELQCIEQVAAVSDRKAEPEAGNFPDGWLRRASGVRQAVEVVSAHQRRPGEDPSKGSPAARALKQAEKDAAAIEGPAAFGTQHERSFALPLDGSTPMPLRQEPVDPVGWLEVAIRQKAEKGYDRMGEVVLVVDFQWMPLEDFELPELAERLADAGIVFCEIWVVSMFKTPPQRVC